MTAAFFLAFILVTAGALLALTRAYLPARTWTVLIAGLALWLIYVGSVSWSGVLSDATRRPPAIVAILLPAALFVFFVFRSRSAGQMAPSIPLSILIGLQSYRVGVELFLHRLWIDDLVPEMLTYQGANFDIWIGATAPVVAWVSSRRSVAGARVALVWNVLGLVALANVVVRSALTAPGPLQLLHTEVANRAVGTFPFTFIAGFFAPLAITLHVLALRSLAARRLPPTTPKGTAA